MSPERLRMGTARNEIRQRHREESKKRRLKMEKRTASTNKK